MHDTPPLSPRQITGVCCTGRSFEFETKKLTLYVWQAAHESEALETARYVADRLKNQKYRKGIFLHDEDAEEQVRVRAKTIFEWNST